MGSWKYIHQTCRVICQARHQHIFMSARWCFKILFFPIEDFSRNLPPSQQELLTPSYCFVSIFNYLYAAYTHVHPPTFPLCKPETIPYDELFCSPKKGKIHLMNVFYYCLFYIFPLSQVVYMIMEKFEKYKKKKNIT